MKNVLIVDDSKVIRMVARKIMTELGFNPIEAADGQEALNRCKEALPDAVLLDWNMPVMNGFELLRELRASEVFKDILFIMVTAEATEARISMALQLKVDELILKPFTLEILERKILRVIQ